MGSMAGHLLHTGVVVEKKWAVHPELVMAKYSLVGGPATGEDNKLEWLVGKKGRTSLGLAGSDAGFPPCHFWGDSDG